MKTVDLSHPHETWKQTLVISFRIHRENVIAFALRLKTRRKCCPQRMEEMSIFKIRAAQFPMELNFYIDFSRRAGGASAAEFAFGFILLFSSSGCTSSSATLAHI